MRTIFLNAGVFEDLKEGFTEERIETYVSFSSDIKLEGQSIFLNLLQDNGFDVKGFVARLDFLAIEYAFKKGIVKNNIKIHGHGFASQMKTYIIHYIDKMANCLLPCHQKH